MNFKRILAIDPSGNFEEGQGTTGICFWNCETNKIQNFYTIRASRYKQKEEYWQAHLNFISSFLSYGPEIIVVIEDFMLDPARALQQSHSRMETSKLIGIMQTYLFQKKIAYAMQRPAEVKTRWADPILLHKGVLVRVNKSYYLPDGDKIVNKHCRDAIRHAIHFDTFKNGRKR
jgi:hypothetical protein